MYLMHINGLIRMESINRFGKSSEVLGLIDGEDGIIWLASLLDSKSFSEKASDS